MLRTPSLPATSRIARKPSAGLSSRGPEEKTPCCLEASSRSIAVAGSFFFVLGLVSGVAAVAAAGAGGAATIETGAGVALRVPAAGATGAGGDAGDAAAAPSAEAVVGATGLATGTGAGAPGLAAGTGTGAGSAPPLCRLKFSAAGTSPSPGWRRPKFS